MLALVAAQQEAEKIALREVPEPVPGTGDTLIEVRAISINRGEVNRLATAEDGWRPGWDVAGVVIARAADGTGPPAGSRVVGLSNFGGWCERLAIPAPQLAVIPGAVGFAAAAALPVAGVTALRTLRVGGMLLGRRVLVTGGSGGVGRFAIQLGAQAGAEITAVVGRADRGAGLTELGAQVVVGIEAAEGRFDHILEAAGGASLEAALARVQAGGSIVTFGNSSREKTTFQVSDFYFQGATLRGFFLLEDARRDPVGRDLGLLLGLVDQGRLDPHVSLEAGWSEAARALAELRERRLAGKAVLHVGR